MPSETPIILFCWHGDLSKDHGGGTTVAIDRIRFCIESGFDVHIISRTPAEFFSRLGRCEAWKFDEPLQRQLGRFLYRRLGETRVGRMVLRLGYRRAGRYQQMLEEESEEGVRKVDSVRDSKSSADALSSFARPRNPYLIGSASQLISTINPDIVFVSFAWNAVIFDLCPEKTFKILDTHDIQHRRAQIALASGGDLKNRACSAEEELAELKKADLVLGIQRAETGLLKSLSSDIAVVTVGHAPPLMERMGSPEESRTLLFVANLYDPNVRGLQQFLKDDWPSLCSAGWDLRVIGTICSAFPASVQNVDFVGEVADLRSHYVQAAIVLNLAAYGTGLPIKSIEGLAAGKVVLSRVECSECFSEEAPLLRFRSGEAFETIGHLGDDVVARRILEEDAATYSERNLSSEAVYGDFRMALSAAGLWPETPTNSTGSCGQSAHIDPV